MITPETIGEMLSLEKDKEGNYIDPRDQSIVTQKTVNVYMLEKYKKIEIILNAFRQRKGIKQNKEKK